MRTPAASAARDVRAEMPGTATPAAGRPVRADKARNRARILAAASDVFAEAGPDAQMDEIALRAGVAVGTLYRHFATKDALMVAIVERKFHAALENLRRALERTDADAFEILTDTVRDRAEITAGDAAGRDAVMRADDALWSQVAHLTSALDEGTQVLVDRARKAGTVRDDLSASDVTTLLVGVAATMGSKTHDWRRHLAIVLDGLRARPTGLLCNGC